MELWTYFRSVIDWVDSMFPTYRKRLMNGLPWDIMFNAYSSNTYNPATLKARIAVLEQNEDVTNQNGIYEYVLGGAEKCLNIRNFSEKDKRRKYAEQGGGMPSLRQTVRV